MKTSRRTILAAALAASFLCPAAAFPAVVIEIFPPAAYIATARPVYFEGRAAYWYRDRWYYRDGRAWRYYHDEPHFLREYRDRHPVERHYYEHWRR